MVTKDMDIKPASSNPTMIFGSNTDNPVFQFNTSSTKTNEKPTETTNNAFQFSAAKTVPSFANSTTQGFGDKPAFQLNAQKTDDQKSQLSSSSFGNQTAAVASFKFGGGEKPAVFGSTFTSPNQPIEFSNEMRQKLNHLNLVLLLMHFSLVPIKMTVAQLSLVKAQIHLILLEDLVALVNLQLSLLCHLETLHLHNLHHLEILLLLNQHQHLAA
ncbi:uncharacterized protein LOC126901829 [Daktulosphaira vitifoliae]|uniref:uncharacterized protein LOC126901829 n=1 Tax=Daktulosphaira vitifoliae TaxID=58002 RepID=UPI0021AA0740|nr:uncharacterized protein LOC126901829 [Daktulosphaira vitifoliae]XP_050534598.1 uncharacterized protein LOC126901829 [Daktulosphaira vitifoliae]